MMLGAGVARRRRAVSKLSPSIALVLIVTAVLSAAAQPSRKVDINSASIDELQTVPGVDAAMALKIVAGRPSRGTADLLIKNIVSQATFHEIGSYLVAGDNAPTSSM